MRKLASRLLLVLAIALFVVSFFLPVIEDLPFGGGPFTGAAAFVFCLLLPFDGAMARPVELLEYVSRAFMFAASLANFAMVFGMFGWLAGKRWLVLWASLLAIALAAPIQAMGALESPREFLGAAYWVWSASFVVLLFASLVAPGSAHLPSLRRTTPLVSSGAFVES